MPKPTNDERVVVLLPLKGFGAAKERLAPALDPDRRAALAEQMATIVVGATGALPVVVVTDDGEVAHWADRHGARLLFRPARGLDDAVQHSVATLATEGVDRVIVTHGDLPLARSIDRLAGPDGVTIVPDRHRDGTNIISVPAAAGFRFAYGPGSFGRHRAEAERLDLSLHLVLESPMAWDVDHPEDLDDIAAFMIAEY